jgi:Ca2+:H+ antiporter
MFEKLVTAAREEWFLGISVSTSTILLVFEPALAQWLSAPPGLGFLFVWLFLVVLGSCLSVVRHADHLAIRLGEPYGTLILTLAVTIIEVVAISALTTHGDGNPALVRDTILAVVMILLNGMVGISLLLGGWRHREQQYNLQGANTYLGVIIPLTVLTLILPNFTVTTPGPTLSSEQEIFVALVSIGLYAAFLAVQTLRHRSYFTLDHDELGRDLSKKPVSPFPHAVPGDAAEDSDHEMPHGTARHPATHALLLAAYMVPLVFLAEKLTRPIDALIEILHAPIALGGIVIAVLVAAPEAVGAVRAAAANRLQRSMNIFLGSVLATIGLTVPAMITLSLVTGHGIVLGLQNANAVMLILTLVVSLVTFSSGRTNVLQGAIHLVLFGAYILLIFQG